jgi:hypothetical protein
MSWVNAMLDRSTGLFSFYRTLRGGSKGNTIKTIRGEID